MKAKPPRTEFAKWYQTAKLGDKLVVTVEGRPPYRYVLTSIKPLVFERVKEQA